MSLLPAGKQVAECVSSVRKDVRVFIVSGGATRSTGNEGTIPSPYLPLFLVRLSSFSRRLAVYYRFSLFLLLQFMPTSTLSYPRGEIILLANSLFRDSGHNTSRKRMKQ